MSTKLRTTPIDNSIMVARAERRVVTPAFAAADVAARLLVIVGYAALVVWAAAHHELWRDELRALTIALDTPSFAAVPAALANEGHPALWYLLLRAAHAIVGSVYVLPVVSLLLAVGTAAIVVFRAPWSLAEKAIFLLGFFPAYEYAVMTRSYGLSALLFVAICARWASRRRSSLLLAVLVALLANTSIHAAVVATGLLVAFAWDAFARPGEEPRGDRRREIAAAALMAAGIVLCLVQVVPDDTSLIRAVRPPVGLWDMIRAAGTVVANPGAHFPHVGAGFATRIDLWWLPGEMSVAGAWIANAAILAVLWQLRRAPASLLLVLIATVGLGMLFQLVYPGLPRHQGLLYLTLVAAVWLSRGHLPGGVAGRRPGTGDLALILLFAIHAASGWSAIERDTTHALSSTPAFAQWLAADRARGQMIVIGEPDYLIEGLPFYAPNRVYLVREDRFGSSPTWTTAARRDLRLGDLLASAERLAAEERTPVLIVLGRRYLEERADTVHQAYGRSFQWSAEEHERFMQRARPVIAFDDAVGDENYTIYRVDPPVERSDDGTAGPSAAPQAGRAPVPSRRSTS